MRVKVSGCVWVAFLCCCFACDCVLELVVCRVRFARVSCPWLRFECNTNLRDQIFNNSHRLRSCVQLRFCWRPVSWTRSVSGVAITVAMPSEELELGEARKVAATKIAAIQRGNQARKSIKEEHEAAVKLQAVHRGMAMRRSNFNLAEATHVAARASPSASAIAAKKPLTMAQLGLRTGLPKNPVPALRFLKFFAWWHEMGTKRYMELCFDLETELFQVVLDKQVQVLDPSIVNQPLKESIFDVISTDTKVMSMHLHEKLSGNQHAESLRRPHLQCWDLHVGCRINVLGRPTTLMQCDLVTAQWLEYHS